MNIFIIGTNETDSKHYKDLLSRAGYTDIHCEPDLRRSRNLLGLEDQKSVTGNMIGTELFILNTHTTGDLELCQQIRQSTLYQDVPVIILSEVRLPEHLHRAFAFGAADYLTKPVDEHEFTARVRSVLRLRYEIVHRKARERELMEITKQLSDLNTILTRLSLLDGLTGIANRRCFDRSFDLEWRRSYRNKGVISLLFIDVDYFKVFNDRYGHSAGDNCLVQVAKKIQSCLRRPGDVVARFGEDEFGLILPDTPIDGAQSVAMSVLEGVRSLCLPNEFSPLGSRVTISVGVSSAYPTQAQSPSSLLAASDRALYLAKEKGRNLVEVFVSPDSLFKAAS